MEFSIIYDPSRVSNLVYAFKRELFRIQDNFFMFLLIALVLTLVLTWLYYSYIMETVRHHAGKMFAKVRHIVTQRHHTQKAAQRQSETKTYTKTRQATKQKRKQLMTQFEK